MRVRSQDERRPTQASAGHMPQGHRAQQNVLLGESQTNTRRTEQKLVLDNNAKYKIPQTTVA